MSRIGELTDKQKLFCRLYVKYWNITKAYHEAYGCKWESAGKNGHRLMKKEGIRREIERLKKEHAEALGIDARVILQRWIDIAFADITDFVEFGTEEVIAETGDIEKRPYVRIKNDTEVDGSLISQLGQWSDIVYIRLEDRIKALEWLSDYVGLTGNNIKDLEREKLALEIERIKAKIEKEQGRQNTIILTNEDEMRRILEARRNKNE